MIGETPETFLGLDLLLNNDVDRKHNLSNRNQVFLCLMWLRQYPLYSTLALPFNVSFGTITEEIRRIINIMDEKLKQLIKWQSIDQWRDLMHAWSKVHIAVGAIDGTSHQIYWPQTELQQEHYSGHRHCHVIHTQVVVYCRGNLRVDFKHMKTMHISLD